MCIRRNIIPLILFCFLATVLAPQGWAQDDLVRAQEHYKLGRKFYRTGQTERAIEELYNALSVEEVYFDAQMLLARSLLTARRPREAVAMLRGVDAIERGKVSYQKLLGKAYYQANKLREASSSLNYAIAEASRPDPELHYYHGLVELRWGNSRNAIRDARRALAISPRYRPARKLLSDAYLMDKDMPRAAKQLAIYLKYVRDREEAAAMRTRLKALRSLSRAKSEKTVTTSFVHPQILTVPKPFYTLEARRNRIEGTVKVEVLLGSDGRIQQVILVQGLGFGLDEETIQAAKEIRFKPGENNGKPVSVWMRILFPFMFSYDDEKPINTKSKIAALSPARPGTTE
jgi:TonB family protein